MVIASLILSNLFETHIYQVSSLFIGFIIFAIPLIIKEEKENVKGKYKNLIFTIIGIIVVSAITYFNPQTGIGANIDITSLNLGLALYVFVAGMIAISAMILPGISGSTLLLIFGLYMPIITGIKETLHFNLSYIPVLFVFGLGVIAGIALIIKIGVLFYLKLWINDVEEFVEILIKTSIAAFGLWAFLIIIISPILSKKILEPLDKITKAEQENIFDRFYRVDKSRNKETGGVGLGLAIAKSIANVNGAEIKLESELGKGSKFIIIFKEKNLKWQKR